jgi:hypothetical protein
MSAAIWIMNRTITKWGAEPKMRNRGLKIRGEAALQIITLFVLEMRKQTQEG